MIITRTPFRMSFAGGGTDLPAFYQVEPGAVLSTTINKYVYITVNRKFDHRIRVSYSLTENVAQVDQIQHPLVREALIKAEVDGGIEITSISDIPSNGSGLGSSSAYLVGLLKALYAFRGLAVTPEVLAQEACDIEMQILAQPIGKQDQYAAAYGGFRVYQFNPDESVHSEPVLLGHAARSELLSNLVLFYTGVGRSATKILEAQSAQTKASDTQVAFLRYMRDQAKDMKRLFETQETDISEMLDVGWGMKRNLAPGISSNYIDGWYDIARREGALGGKILGAGGGGFLLLYAPPEKHQHLTNTLKLERIPFAFAPEGSKIIFHQD